MKLNISKEWLLANAYDEPGGLMACSPEFLKAADIEAEHGGVTVGGMTFGQYLKALRLDRRITLREMALRSGCDLVIYSGIERDRSLPTKELYGKVVRVLIDAGCPSLSIAELDSKFPAALVAHYPTAEEIAGKLPAFFNGTQEEADALTDTITIGLTIEEAKP